jgi:hypothetical protein
MYKGMWQHWIVLSCKIFLKLFMLMYSCRIFIGQWGKLLVWNHRTASSFETFNRDCTSLQMFSGKMRLELLNTVLITGACLRPEIHSVVLYITSRPVSGYGHLRATFCCNYRSILPCMLRHYTHPAHSYTRNGLQSIVTRKTTTWSRGRLYTERYDGQFMIRN